MPPTSRLMFQPDRAYARTNTPIHTVIVAGIPVAAGGATAGALG